MAATGLGCSVAPRLGRGDPDHSVRDTEARVPDRVGTPVLRGAGAGGNHTPARASASSTLGVFAEFETNLRRKRQLDGIAKAKAAGISKGRPASIDAARVRGLKAQGLERGRDRQGPPHRPGERLQGTGGRRMSWPSWSGRADLSQRRPLRLTRRAFCIRARALEVKVDALLTKEGA